MIESFLLASVIFLSVPGTWNMIHSLQYCYTGSSGLKRFPEFVAVGIVDGELFSYYDSDLKKVIPKQDWIAQNEGPEYWKIETQKLMGAQQSFRDDITTAMQRFNQTEGVHVNQRMFGCEWDDETEVVYGFNQFGYDGEDFIAFDPKTQTWTAPVQQAVMTKLKWEKNKAYTASQINYLTKICPEWLKKYVNYGKSSLLRTELPSVSILQKPSSSPVRCFATGFYPNRAEMFWRKDGEEFHEGVEKYEILPNDDRTFQTSVSLDLSSEKPEDWTKYECVFQLTGAKEDVIVRLEKLYDGNSTGLLIGVVVCLLVIVIVAVGVGVWYRRRHSNGFKQADSSDTCSYKHSEHSYPKKESFELRPMLA